MKIKYEFADGTVSEVEVEESIGAVIIEYRRLEDNLSRKERYHCYSLDAAQFEGAEYVLSLVEEAKKECKDPVVLIEQRLDFSRFVEEGFGTGDCVIIADGTLYIQNSG